jgi:rhodanese-related sulfurtransferase
VRQGIETSRYSGRDCRYPRIAVLGVWLLAICNAQAQPAATPPTVFQNLQPAASECKRQDAVPQTAAKPAKADTVKPDLSCAIAPSTLAALLTRPDTVLADVRPAADYAAYHLNGALNLTAAELRTKPFVKSKAVVLIGNGQAERELYAECARLKASGFKQPKVLRGGLPIWLASGQAVLGRTPDTAQTAQLGPGELWAEARFDANLVLVTADRKDLLHELPSATVIPDAKLAAVQAAVKQRGNKPLAAVVLVTTSADGPAVLPNLRLAVQPVPLLAYTGTAEAYTRQLAQQNAVWTAQALGPKKPRCGS